MEVSRVAAPSRHPDGDERLHLVIREMDVVILDKGPTLVWLGVCPSQFGHGDARGVQQSILHNEEVSKQLTALHVAKPRITTKTFSAP